MPAVWPGDLRFDTDVVHLQTLTPFPQHIPLNTKRYVPGTATSMQRYRASIDCDRVLLRLRRIEDQKNALLAPENQLSPRHREDFWQTKNLAVKTLRFFQFIGIEDRFQNAIHAGVPFRFLAQNCVVPYSQRRTR